MENIFLTGFMGVGKTVVGQNLAQKLQLPFVDTDALIEKRAKQSIPEIFKKSEETFRNLEEAVISDVVAKTGQVVSLGGGALLRQNSRLKVLGAGHLFYLSATAKTLKARLENSHFRPLLLSKNVTIDTIANLLRERQPIYEIAHDTIITDEKTVEDIVHEILLKVGTF